jgi:hypothetical protein
MEPNFGKSVDDAIWLDKDKLPVNKFYDFWLNDADVEKLLNLSNH